MALSPRKHSVLAENPAANTLLGCSRLHKVTLFSKMQNVSKMASSNKHHAAEQWGDGEIFENF